MLGLRPINFAASLSFLALRRAEMNLICSVLSRVRDSSRDCVGLVISAPGSGWPVMGLSYVLRSVRENSICF